MGKAVFRTFLLLTAVAVSCALVNWVLVPNSMDAYQAAKLDKLDLLRRTPSPKIVLVGGSNLAFSVDSELLAAEYGMPVVNMGLAKSVGLSYLLEESKPYIGEGDVVILAMEHELFFDMFYGSDGLIVELQYVPSGFKNMTLIGEFATFARKFGPIMQAKFAGFLRTGSSSREDPVYRRDGFNDYGDLTTHLDEPPSFEVHELFPDDTEFQEESIEVLNEFYLEILSRGGRVVLTCPPLVNVEWAEHEERIQSLYKRLKTKLSFPVISDPSDYVYSVRQMYDTAYHLRRDGRRQRTYQLINDLDKTDGIGFGGTKGEAI